MVKVANRKLLFVVISLVMQTLGMYSAVAGTDYYALDNASVSIKDPARTPLVAITRAGQRLFAVGLHGIIIVSSDNGLSWTQASVPVDLTLTAIYFESEDVGWAVGHYGAVLWTTNGGLTWTRSVDGLDVIKALNLAANQVLPSQNTPPAEALKQRVATAFQRAGPSKPFLAVGSCGNGVLAAGQQDMAVFSADGGKTWNEWTSMINNPTFRNIYGIVRSGDSTFLIGESGLILKGDRNCSNFKTIAGPFSATLFGGITAQNNIMLVYGLNGGIFKTSDGGDSWKDISISGDSVVNSGVQINSGRVLLGTLGGNLFLSDASAENFHQIPVAVPFQISAIAIAPNGNVVVVGNGGVQIIPSSAIH